MMKKNLLTGDIVVLRSGNVAVVIRNEKEDYLLFQNGGWECLDDYSEDMMYLYSDSDETDAIMKVFRSVSSGISFFDFEEEELIFERDLPLCEVLDKTTQRENVHPLSMTEEHQQLHVIAQQFYGNKTHTTIDKADVDYFLKGILEPQLFPHDADSVIRKVVRIPNAEYIAVVYDQHQEDLYAHEEFPAYYASEAQAYRDATGHELTMPVTFKIPEIGLELHTRCFVCRVDAHNQLCSLESSDIQIVNRYLTSKGW